jgi:signal transduction histidine kinase
MESPYIDRRVIQILRWAILIQIILLALSSLSPLAFLRGQEIQVRVDVWSLASILLMLAILIGLSLKTVEGKVTRTAFLAIQYALAVITVIARHLFSYSFSRLFLSNPNFTLFRWDAIFFLIIPLVFIAWQYSMKEVIIYSLAVMFIEEIPILFQATSSALVVQAVPQRPPDVPQLPERFLVISSSRNFRIFSVLANTLGSIARSGIFIIVGWIENRLVNLQRSQHQELERANVKLRKFAVTSEKLAQTQERNRIARELHDTLAHTLSSVSVQLEATKALFERNPKEAQKMLAQTIENTKNGLTETRRALVDLRASELESYGLTGAIRNLVQSAAERGGFKANFHLDQKMDTLPEDLAHCLYRVAQEAAENILRHAGAEQVEVSLLPEGNSVILAIRDDGSGFDMNGLESRHLGVRGMRERVEMLGGELSVNSAKNQGTEVKAVIDRAGI